MFKNIVSASLLSLLCLGQFAISMDASHVEVTQTLHDQYMSYKKLAPTLAMMKIFLGEEWHNFSGNPQDDEIALRDNVRLYFGEKKLADHNFLGAQTVNYNEELGTLLCNLIRKEQEEYAKGNVVLYHGLRSDVLFKYKYWASLFSKLTENNLGEFILRGDSLYTLDQRFHEQFQTIHDLRRKYTAEECGDYGCNINTALLHCNIGLFNGGETSLSTASSVAFWDDGCWGPDAYAVDKYVLSSLAFQGMSLDLADKCKDEVQKLFEKYYPHNSFDPSVPQQKIERVGGGILAISIPKNKVDSLAQHVHIGGKEYAYHFGKFYGKITDLFNGYAPNDYSFLYDYVYDLGSNASVDKIYEKLVEDRQKLSDQVYYNDLKPLPEEKKVELKTSIQEYLNAKAEDDSFITTILNNISKGSDGGIPTDDAKYLTNEIILYLKPEALTNIYGLFRYQLNEQEKVALQSNLDTLVNKHIKLLRGGRYRSIDSAFYLPILEDKTKPCSPGAISILIERGFITKAEELLAENPNFYEEPAQCARVLEAVYQALDNVFFIDKESNLIKELNDFSSIPSIFNKKCPSDNIDCLNGFYHHISSICKPLKGTRLYDETFRGLMFFFDHTSEDLEIECIKTWDPSPELLEETLREVFVRNSQRKAIR